jgi:hypothetical protein
VKNIKGVPAGTWVPEIRPSRYDAGTAFVVFDNHRRGDTKPYLVKTTDYGKSWTSLVTPDLQYFLHAIEQDPVNPNLLFLGSEFGMYVSLDGGKQWHRWENGLPRVPVRGLVVHPTEGDLVIGTHGRAAYVLDDVRPLRALADHPEIANEPLHLFPIPPAIQYQMAEADGIRFTGFSMFLGDNRPYGALLSYLVGGAAPAGDSAQGKDSLQATIEVLDASGTVVRTFKRTAKHGFNRTAWDLSLDGPHRPERPGAGGAPGGAEGFFGGGGPDALPGDYTIRVIVKSDTAVQTVTVRPDPRLPYTLADRRAKLAALQDVMHDQEIAFETQDRLRRAKSGIDEVLERLRDKSDSASKALRQDGDSLKKQLGKVQEEFSGREDVQGIFDQPDVVMGLLGNAYGMMGSSWAAPSPTELTRAKQAHARLAAALDKVNPALQAVDAYRQRAIAAGLEIFPAIETITMDWKWEKK